MLYRTAVKAVAEEHAIWQGAHYRQAREKWAIIGFSHYDRDWTQPDRSCSGLDARRADFTLQLLTQTVQGQCDLRFFRDIAKAFGMADREARQSFWNKVVFFNYLPHCVEGHEMYRTATYTERTRANERFREALATYQPHRVFVFSKKAWKLLPPTEEAKAGQPLRPLSVLTYVYGTYTTGTERSLACCLQHPTHADHSLLRRGVSAFLGIAR